MRKTNPKGWRRPAMVIWTALALAAPGGTALAGTSAADAYKTGPAVENGTYPQTKPMPDDLQGRRRVLRGTVTDESGPLVGATVVVKGSTEGTVTDLDGRFELLTDHPSPVIVVSFVGYRPQEVTVKGDTPLQIRLRTDAQKLDEVVVTALGIKRSEKALSYQVRRVAAEDITANKDVNLVNALSGKVAGVNINASSSGTGGAAKVVMRGTKSIMQISGALYVVDGVPLLAGREASGGKEFDSRGSSEPIADLNPEDIESMSVLTGAAAAALYGSEAANGAIIITTKKGKEGKVSLTVGQSTEFATAFVTPRFQNRYGTGTGGAVSTGSAMSWGRRLTDLNNYGYNPVDNYLQTGVITTENVAISTGTERNQTYASAAVVGAKGIIPHNRYDRKNFTVRNTTTFLADRMTLDAGAGYVIQTDRNMTNQGTYNNPLVGAYLFPRGNDWADIRVYERYDAARKISTQYWPVGDEGMVMQNPYWINHRNLRENDKNRYMLHAGLTYRPVKWLTLAGRVRMDHATNTYEERFWASTNTQLTESSTRGLYGVTRSTDKQLYADFLASVDKTFADRWSLQVNVGASYSDMRYDAMQVRGPIADGGDAFADEPLGLTNYFALQNLSASKTKRMQEGWREQTQSVFGSVEAGYRNTYYLTLTGRGDWPSQLAGPNSPTTCFFYPSIGASVVLSELFPNLDRRRLSFMKVRGSFASVGSAFARYLANPRYEWNESTNSWSNQTQYPVYDLKPERTNSWELGLNIRFLQGFELDVTYYDAKTMNQTFNPQLPVSGYSALYVQTGAVRNRGVELSLGYKHTWGKVGWDTGLTFSTNQNRILTLADNAVNPVTGERFSLSTLNMGGLGDARFLLKEGGGMGDLYSLRDIKRDANGKIYVDPDGHVATEAIQDPDKYIKLGSVLPKGNLAWRNHLTWRNISAGFLLSARLGGIVHSRTQAMLDYYGVSEASADAREQGYVLVNGTDRIDPEAWYGVVGSGTCVPQYYTYSATNVRLQEVSVGYTIPRKWLGGVCEATVSFVGRNLWMIYCKAPFDPESVASTDNFYQGIDYFMMPAQRTMGFRVNFNF